MQIKRIRAVEPLQIQNWVADKLPRPVIGDVAAAFDPMKGESAPRQRVLIH